MLQHIELGDDPLTTLLMTAYRSASKAARQQDKESEGWVPRIAEIDSLSPEQLSEIHGTAIAADLLDVRVEDALTGLRYKPRKVA